MAVTRRYLLASAAVALGTTAQAQTPALVAPGKVCGTPHPVLTGIITPSDLRFERQHGVW